MRATDSRMQQAFETTDAHGYTRIGAHIVSLIRVHPCASVVSYYNAASLELRRSVISIEPGACVMQNSGFTAATAACGVTPQAQNTGSSSLPTGTASP